MAGRRWRSVINWRKVQFWWPTAMLVIAWVLLALMVQSESWGVVYEGAVIVFGLINLPALVPVGAMLGLLQRTDHVSV